VEVDYERLRQRIDKRCKLLSIISIPDIPKERFDAIRRDAHGISTLELTYIARGLHTTISSLMFEDN
jgi:hypothetical protein